MVDQGGPGTVNIKACTSTGLADLGDTVGFDEPGKENELYAFQLEEGIYKRKEVSVGGVQTFGELTDVNLEAAVQNKPYQFILHGDEWIPYFDPLAANGGWDLDVKIEQPYIHIGKDHELRKIQNSGKLLASYHTHKDFVLKNTDFGYVVAKRKNKGGALRLKKEFDFGQPAPGSTIILDIVLGETPAEPVEVLRGVKLKWLPQHANKLLRLFIRIPKGQEVTLLKLSLLKITTDIKKEDISYDFIHLHQIQFKRLRYTTLDLGTPYLERLI